MGNCCNSKASDESVIYEKSVVLYISHSDASSKYIPKDKVKFETTYPVKEICEMFNVGGFKLQVSSCIIPGQDPRGEVGKVCQDNVFICSNHGLVLATLFDGHGSKGEEVVAFSEQFMLDYFMQNDFSLDAEQCLKSMFIECDMALNIPTSKINCYGSGTTAVSILFTPKGIYVASVGDSRAILATLPHAKYIPEAISSDKNYKKKYTPLRALEPIQLTIDQKPNLEEELNRIVSCGGIVSRVKDNEGNCVGPYRVFQKGKQIPGLAMSRSLGDIAAKKVGVVSSPIVSFYPLVPFRDQFIVIASDGVWDALENSEAANFIEKFRGKCLKYPNYNDKSLNASPSNSTISKLFVEEARFRWFGVCSTEDVLIDDISAIIIEIMSTELLSDCEEVDSRLGKDTASYIEVISEHTFSQSHRTVKDTLISSYQDDSQDTDNMEDVNLKD